ncbi:hypothetical protein CspHIS471_0301560 [Cutaneotrichosporon sp. HIS471]|nr:hypothetical protein CspHIS471_0301560 [Cutaneotrichosporon sp. HIS471]
MEPGSTRNLQNGGYLGPNTNQPPYTNQQSYPREPQFAFPPLPSSSALAPIPNAGPSQGTGRVYTHTQRAHPLPPNTFLPFGVTDANPSALVSTRPRSTQADLGQPTQYLQTLEAAGELNAPPSQQAPITYGYDHDQVHLQVPVMVTPTHTVQQSRLLAGLSPPHFAAPTSRLGFAAAPTHAPAASGTPIANLPLHPAHAIPPSVTTTQRAPMPSSRPLGLSQAPPQVVQYAQARPAGLEGVRQALAESEGRIRTVNKRIVHILDRAFQTRMKLKVCKSEEERNAKAEYSQRLAMEFNLRLKDFEAQGQNWYNTRTKILSYGVKAPPVPTVYDLLGEIWWAPEWTDEAYLEGLVVLELKEILGNRYLIKGGSKANLKLRLADWSRKKANEWRLARLPPHYDPADDSRCKELATVTLAKQLFDKRAANVGQAIAGPQPAPTCPAPVPVQGSSSKAMQMAGSAPGHVRDSQPMRISGSEPGRGPSLFEEVRIVVAPTCGPRKAANDTVTGGSPLVSTAGHIPLQQGPRLAGSPGSLMTRDPSAVSLVAGSFQFQASSSTTPNGAVPGLTIDTQASDHATTPGRCHPPGSGMGQVLQLPNLLPFKSAVNSPYNYQPARLQAPPHVQPSQQFSQPSNQVLHVAQAAQPTKRKADEAQLEEPAISKRVATGTPSPLGLTSLYPMPPDMVPLNSVSSPTAVSSGIEAPGAVASADHHSFVNLLAEGGESSGFSNSEATSEPNRVGSSHRDLPAAPDAETILAEFGPEDLEAMWVTVEEVLGAGRTDHAAGDLEGCASPAKHDSLFPSESEGGNVEDKEDGGVFEPLVAPFRPLLDEQTVAIMDQFLPEDLDAVWVTVEEVLGAARADHGE